MVALIDPITKAQARRFLLAYHHLLPPHQLTGKQGILDYFQRVGSIQFDPVEAVGRNPELVLQARVKEYRPVYLEELLYKDRLLVDGWDKVACILPSTDWPYFNRYRDRVRQKQVYPGGRIPQDVLSTVLAAIAERGPLSSLELDHLGSIDWHWGVPVRVERAALDTLYGMGAIGVQRRSGSRRYYDLVERLLPAEILSAPDPHPTEEDHLDWHVLRRIGSLGLASNGAGEHWGGIFELKSKARTEVLQRLLAQGKVLALAIEELKGKQFYLRTSDLPLLEWARAFTPPPADQAVFLGPLDNLLWDRDLLRQVFDFDYVWEVYKPQALRKYGYYTLPILVGERFAARFSPAFEKKSRTLRISGWWWEDAGSLNTDHHLAMRSGLQNFMAYLGALRLEPTPELAERPDLSFLSSV